MNPVIVKCFCVYFLLLSSTGASDEMQLSRKRRQLLFPEGSSLQLVYDQVVPVVGWTQLFITGISVALAFQLPSEPINLQELRDRLKSKQLVENQVTTNLTANATKANDHNHSSEIEYHLPMYYNGPYTNEYHPWRTPPDVAWKGAANWRNQYGERYNANKYRRIYPMLKKRSADTTLTAREYFINHHRATRHAFYGKLEKFLEEKGVDGRSCVLRAICETANPTDHHATPGSFLNEIVRAVFTLPRYSQNSRSVYHSYDLANESVEDCLKLYSACMI